MSYGLDWSAYGRTSFRQQFADGVRWHPLPARRSRLVRELMKPGKCVSTWPGWQAANVKSWW